MNYQDRLYLVILGPCITEKANRVAEAHRQIVFKVRPDADKYVIQAAVEKCFKVQVDSVRVLNVKGKKRRFGKVQGCRKDWKKAYVTLKEGFDIDFEGQKVGAEVAA